jgi:hypothetical protein
LEGTSPNYAQALAIGTERTGPGSSILTLQYANGASGFKIWKEKNGSQILNASGVVANGWQQTLTRAGTAFSGTNMTNLTDIGNIVGRVCPSNVFRNFTDMTATGRCVYYTASVSTTLNAAQGTSGAIEAEDFLNLFNNAPTGRGSASSYYEGNIKVCADKGMRLPVAYETNMVKPNTFYWPSGDTGVTPVWGVTNNNGVPDLGASVTPVTASAFVISGNYANYICYNSTASYSCHYGNSATNLRCVLPSH